jgi:hypothetical protein
MPPAMKRRVRMGLIEHECNEKKIFPGCMGMFMPARPGEQRAFEQFTVVDSATGKLIVNAAIPHADLESGVAVENVRSMAAQYSKRLENMDLMRRECEQLLPDCSVAWEPVPNEPKERLRVANKATDELVGGLHFEHAQLQGDDPGKILRLWAAHVRNEEKLKSGVH